MKGISLFFAILILICFALSCEKGQTEKGIDRFKPYPEEMKAVMGRGLVALPKGKNQIFVSWRLLPDDPKGISFNIFRKEVRNHKALELIAQTDRTFYIDGSAKENKRYAYAIRPVLDGKEGDLSREAEVSHTGNIQNALVFDLGQDYKMARGATGDLNGDGELEVVIAYSNNRNVDPAENFWKKSEDTIKVAAFLHTGERLWTIDLGWGIEAGGVYSPIVVWDIDADGKAEVLLKTNKSGNPLGYDSDYLSILDGETGKIKDEAKWPSAEGLGNDYNSNSRNYLAIAHLDGKNTYIIAARGLYKIQRIWAYDNKLNRVWERIIGRHIDSSPPVNNRWLKRIWKYVFKDRARGSHSLPLADVNDDGKEEIFWGEHCIGENGRDLWVVNDRMPYHGQPDIVFVADILPHNKGKEVYYCREGWSGKIEDNIGMLLVNDMGKTIWGQWGYGHVDGGWCANILPNQDGMQCFGYDVLLKKWNNKGAEYARLSTFLWSSDGKLITNPSNSWILSFPVDWDGDGVKEICLETGDIQKFDGRIVAKLGSGVLWGADLFGDHREEIVIAPQDRKVYIFFNTENIKGIPRITKAADRQYRNDLSRTAMQFNVIPTEGGYVPKRH
ncbi:MAG: hypothetical protein AB1390_02815 [Nitrospirota bacterium]